MDPVRFFASKWWRGHAAVNYLHRGGATRIDFQGSRCCRGPAVRRKSKANAV